MNSDTEQNLDPDVTGAEAAGDAKSILQRIVSNREARGDTKKFPVPTWEGDLLMEVAILATDDIQAMIRRARASANGGASNSMNADADFLIKACVGVYAYDSENDREVKLIESLQNEWQQLVAMIDPRWPEDHPQAGESVKINSPRELVAYLVKWKGLVLASFGQRVGRWMQNPSINFEDPQ